MEHVKGRKFTEKKEKENKVEEIQLTNLASLGSLARMSVGLMLGLPIPFSDRPIQPVKPWIDTLITEHKKL